MFTHLWSAAIQPIYIGLSWDVLDVQICCTCWSSSCDQRTGSMLILWQMSGLQTHLRKSILGSGCSRFSKINLLAKAKLHSKDQSESYNPLHQQPLCQGWSWEREWTVAPKQSNDFTCLNRLCLAIAQYKAPIWTLPSYSWCYIFSTLIIFLWTVFLYKLENCILKCIRSAKAELKSSHEKYFSIFLVFCVIVSSILKAKYL